jgi:hypothetical protein
MRLRGANMQRAGLAIFLLSASLATDAQNQNQWSVYGFSQENTFFFAAGDVQRNTDGHLEVWTKALSAKQIDAAVEKAGKEKDNDRSARIAWAATDGSPPISRVRKMSPDEILNVAIEEDVANNSPEVQPLSQVLYEVDCSRRMMKMLSGIAYKNGQTRSSNRPSEWMHVPPDSNGSNLLGMLCSAKTGAALTAK